MGLLVIVLLRAASASGNAGDLTADSPEDPGKENQCSVVESQSTLSSLGIDFGAAELLRYTELDLSHEQKNQALGVVREVRPTIDRLCDRMTRALKMGELTPEARQAKKGELETIVDDFKQVQEQIMGGLHAIITAEQAAKLQTIKRREQDFQARAKPERAR